MAEPLVDVRGVWKEYDDGIKRVVALKDIDFQMQPNEFVALVGQSGCGKSTLLRLLCGLDVPTKGEVRYQGRPIRVDDPKVTMVFQNFALMPWLDIHDNVVLGLKAQRVERKKRDAKAQDLLDVVGLGGFENAYPRELSSGMKQRVGLARALATDPILLCMDEPFSMLDALSAETLREEVLRLWADPSLPPDAVVMVTHNVEEAVYMADRVIVFGSRPGRIVADVPITLPRPREKKSEEFYEMTDRIYKLIA